MTYQSGDFEPLVAAGYKQNSDGQAMLDSVNALMNSEVHAAPDLGIEMLKAGPLSQSDLGRLVALASIARQRDIASPQVLDFYFGFDGSDPAYLDFL